MSTILNNRGAMEKLDSKNMRGSIALLSAQIEEAWNAGKKISWSKDKRAIANVVVVGMGGSTLGTHVIQALYRDMLRVPVTIVNDYHIPRFVGKNTLVIMSSYSGTTEEPIAAFDAALKRKAHLAVICSGGTMATFAEARKIPALIFSTASNPCNSPRMGLGYSVVGQMVLLAKAGLLNFSLRDMRAMRMAAEMAHDEFGLSVSRAKNQAKQLAEKMAGRTVWFVGAEHLGGNAHIAANQTNENAKRFGGFFLIPELNHHLMEGLPLPKENKKQILFVLLESSFYDKRVQKRFAITREVLSKHGVRFVGYNAMGKTRLEEVTKALVFSSYATFYSALVAGIDPTAIPMVDFFKAQLKK